MAEVRDEVVGEQQGADGARGQGAAGSAQQGFQLGGGLGLGGGIGFPAVPVFPAVRLHETFLQQGASTGLETRG